MTEDEWLALLRSWLESDPGAADDGTWQRIVSEYLNQNTENDRSIAVRFSAPITTVRRWANGSARPHPRIKRVVVQWIAEECNK